MDHIRNIWSALDPRRRLLAVLVTGAAVLLVLAIARLAMQPGMALLYAGLEGPQAGEVLRALDQRRLRYEVRGDAIYVEATARDEARMSLAAEGLPSNTSGGYELLDGLTGFGTTSQMFDAAYWRAKEGELARTIVASPYIRAARVHIAQGATLPFRRDQRASASVTVTPAAAALTQTQAQALRFLVASAVAGLAPEDVAVIDTGAGLVAADDPGQVATGGDRAVELRRSVERLLDAHVGIGRAIVEVTVDTVTDRETIIERVVDPNSRVALRQESEERSATASDTRTAGVSVASNLPDGDAAARDGRSDSRETQSTQRVTYEVSQTSREIQRAPGAIRRLTVAVMIDGRQVPDAQGVPRWEPRPEAELTALRELVASAVGFDAARGDVITLRSLPFEAVPVAAGTDAALSLLDRLDLMDILRLVVLALAIAFLGLFVLRPILRAPRLEALPRGPSAEPVLTGEIEDMGPRQPIERGVPGDAMQPDWSDAPGRSVDPVERMRRLVAERQDESLQILRNWVEQSAERR